MYLNQFLESFVTVIPPGAVRTIILLLALGLLAKICRLPVVKGWFGEKFVGLLFKLHLPKHLYQVYHNVTLPTEAGSTQIDHIVVSRFGIFCIETKNMQGWIFGSERQAKWTQVIFKKKTSFQNPLRQNYKHTETLRTLLNLPKESVHSVIVFVGDSTFKTDMPPNVTYCRGCTDYIRSFKQSVLDDDQVKRVHSAIQTGRLDPTRATHRLHVQHLQELHNTRPVFTPDDAADPEVPFCPKCGAPMKLRSARKGPDVGNQFWGCSSFPKCRGTRSV